MLIPTFLAAYMGVNLLLHRQILKGISTGGLTIYQSSITVLDISNTDVSFNPVSLAWMISKRGIYLPKKYLNIPGVLSPHILFANPKYDNPNKIELKIAKHISVWKDVYLVNNRFYHTININKIIKMDNNGLRTATMNCIVMDVDSSLIDPIYVMKDIIEKLQKIDAMPPIIMLYRNEMSGSLFINGKGIGITSNIEEFKQLDDMIQDNRWGG